MSSIATKQLDLVLLTPVLGELAVGRREQAASLIGAEIPEWWPDAHDAGFLRYRRELVARDPSAGEWLVRAIVLRDAR